MSILPATLLRKNTFFFSSRRRHTRWNCDWSSDVCSSDLTALGDRELSLVDMGNDMADVLKKLGYDKVDVVGYSMGGGVAFQFAAQHPAMVRRLVLVSTPFSQDGFYPEMLPQQAAVGAAMAEQMKETPMYKSYVAIAPHPEEFPKLLDQMGAYM